MSRSVDEIYLSISQMLVKGIETPFSEAVLEVELHALAMKLSGGYLRGDGSEPREFSFIKEHKKILMNDIVELHLKTDLDDKSRWNILNYSLHSDGQYKVEFEWDQKLADEIEYIRTQIA